jgi:hypothetical protein
MRPARVSGWVVRDGTGVYQTPEFSKSYTHPQAVPMAGERRQILQARIADGTTPPAFSRV